MADKPVPTFDEWHQAKYGMSFDEAYGYHMASISEYMKALSRELRDYVSEMEARRG